MTLIRTETQAALNDLFMALTRSEDDYRAAAEQLEDQAAADFLCAIASKRQSLAQRVERAIRAEGGLPSEPDPDLKAGEQLLQMLGPLMADDKTREVFQQRLDADRELLDYMECEDLSALEGSHGELKSECRHHLEESLTWLEKRLQ
ncbi:hypothetical protein [Microbulbifer sp. THAF38]|uniref:hypothetical protein n=1 Tax=Microbulbifer sp. THAF38 TaxID=2587856 RepID=UPI001269489C|nr:hypothetical protein [Microbulbifer sp. THAF38]QFT54531.1 hypothetical protein FIU95_08190 [Microbulbifer sp. THAF38]